MAARLEEITDYVKQFREALQAGLADLSSGTVFQVGAFTVALIEKGPDHISIRVAGQNRRYKLNVLPGNTGLALADFVLDKNSPSTRVIKGAYLLVHPRVDGKHPCFSALAKYTGLPFRFGLYTTVSLLGKRKPA